jgi:hypothetical protein
MLLLLQYAAAWYDSRAGEGVSSLTLLRYSRQLIRSPFVVSGVRASVSCMHSCAACAAV